MDIGAGSMWSSVCACSSARCARRFFERDFDFDFDFDLVVVDVGGIVGSARVESVEGV